jgi:hypothetical protein
MGRAIAILIISALGLGAVIAAAAVVLPQRMVADTTPVVVPVETTESAVIEESATAKPTPSKTPNKLGPGPKGMPTDLKSPKPTKSQKSTETRKAQPTTKPKKPKADPPPKVIGTRYACATLNIRAAAGLNALVVERVPARTKISIVNRSLGKFRMVRWEGKNRWAYQPCLWTKPPAKAVMKKETSPQAKKSVYYKNCDAVRAAGKDPLSRGEPGYARHLDRDNDGEACEVYNRRSTAPRKSTASTAVWDRLAKCESSGNWSINTGNGYYGGLQFSLSTWRAYGGSGYPHKASKAEQIRIANKVRNARGGYGDWPACAAKLGLPR